MKKSTAVRVVGGVILLMMFIVIGRYNIEGPMVAVVLIGFAAAYEYGLVRYFANKEKQLQNKAGGD